MSRIEQVITEIEEFVDKCCTVKLDNKGKQGRVRCTVE